jgi:hypothetical protein
MTDPERVVPSRRRSCCSRPPPASDAPSIVSHINRYPGPWARTKSIPNRGAAPQAWRHRTRPRAWSQCRIPPTVIPHRSCATPRSPLGSRGPGAVIQLSVGLQSHVRHVRHHVCRRTIYSTRSPDYLRHQTLEASSSTPPLGRQDLTHTKFHRSSDLLHRSLSCGR